MLHQSIVPSHFLHERERKHDDFAILECACAAVVPRHADAIQAKQLAAHEKAHDLLATFAVDVDGVEKTAADGVDGFKPITRMEDDLASLQTAAQEGDVRERVELRHRIVCERLASCDRPESPARL